MAGGRAGFCNRGVGGFRRFVAWSELRHRRPLFAQTFSHLLGSPRALIGLPTSPLLLHATIWRVSQFFCGPAGTRASSPASLRICTRCSLMFSRTPTLVAPVRTCQVTPPPQLHGLFGDHDSPRGGPPSARASLLGGWAEPTQLRPTSGARDFAVVAPGDKAALLCFHLVGFPPHSEVASQKREGPVSQDASSYFPPHLRRPLRHNFAIR